jgi:hypothetical protein
MPDHDPAARTIKPGLVLASRHGGVRRSAGLQDGRPDRLSP